MLRLKNDILFIHNPKTGGTSVRQFFNDAGLVVKDYKHIHVPNVKYFEEVPNANHKVPKEKKEKWVSITRNPIDWYSSFFYFMSQKMMQGRKFPKYNSVLRKALDIGYKDNMNFDSFIEYLAKENYPAFSLAYEFYNKDCDYILRLENLKSDLEEFLQKEYGKEYDVESMLKVKNSTKPKKVVSEHAKELIRKLDSKYIYA